MIKDGGDLLDVARGIKARKGVMAAADYMVKHGIGRDLALIALVGLRRTREYGVDCGGWADLRGRRA